MLAVFDQWLVWILPLLVFTAIGFLIYLSGNRQTRPAPGKDDTYTGGEVFPEADLGKEDFYQSIKRALELSKLQNAHTGRLSDYLLMVLVGLAIIMLLLVVVWV